MGLTDFRTIRMHVIERWISDLRQGGVESALNYFEWYETKGVMSWLA